MFSAYQSEIRGERLPWYRAKNYKGDLTETEKRALDALRNEDTHDVSRFEHLAADVQGYIKSLEYDLEQRRRKANFNGSAFLLFCAFISALAAYNGLAMGDELMFYLLSLALVVIAVVLYRARDEQITSEMRATDTFDPSNEGLQQHWELEHILNERQSRAHSGTGS